MDFIHDVHICKSQIYAKDKENMRNVQ